jgi:hypothetical protein
LWEIARYSPAASSVEAATAPSRRDVGRNSRTAIGKRKKYLTDSTYLIISALTFFEV